MIEIIIFSLWRHVDIIIITFISSYAVVFLINFAIHGRCCIPEAVADIIMPRTLGNMQTCAAFFLLIFHLNHEAMFCERKKASEAKDREGGGTQKSKFK